MTLLAEPCGASVGTATRTGIFLGRELLDPSPDLSPAEMVGHWAALRVIRRQEQRVVDGLRLRGCGAYIPIQWFRREESNGHGRPRTWRLYPQRLLPGWVFACYADADAFDAIWDQHAVYGLVRIADQKRFVREMQAIHDAIAAGNQLTQMEGSFNGRRVRMLKGPYRGQAAMAERVDKHYRIELRITTLGGSCSYGPVPADWVEVLE